jgi:dipeptidyl aminopeptidase/acylaminoacyl peptidase
MTLAGEAELPVTRWFIFDKAGGAGVAVAPLPDRLHIDLSCTEPMWSPDGTTIFAAAANSDATHLALVAIDTANGGVRLIHDERSETFIDFNTFIYNKANIALLAQRGEMLWYSQSDGWGHLYAIALGSGAVRRVTEGDWAVLDVIAVTDTQVFFSAGGREPGRNPYYRHLYRVDLDGNAPNAGLTLLTPDDADHGFTGDPTPSTARTLGRSVGLSQMSPSARYFVDAISRVDRAPVYVLRDADGRQITEILRADISALEATGWQPPEMFTAKAADGETDLYGVLIKPRAFAERPSWPVLERIYGGPQINVYPRAFRDGLNGAFTHCINAIAEMGFVVALLDGPGTPSRSKHFHDMTYGANDRWGVGHHRAALEGAAASRPWMDLSKVGVSGHSYGGYGTAMALLLEPDFYKVGVSSAGMYDLTHIYSGGVERHLGRVLKSSAQDMPEDYARMSPSRYADRLVGDLLLVFGDLDENAPPAGLLAFVKALVDAGRGYDLLYLPGANHNFVPWPYYQKQMWDYFIQHIQGRAPLRHHKLDVQPGQRMFI